MFSFLQQPFGKMPKFYICLFLLLSVSLSNCSPDLLVEPPQEVIVSTRPTQTVAMTLTPSATSTPSVPTETFTPTALPQPAATDTITPTPLPWAIKSLGDFVLFQGRTDDMDGINLMQTDGISRFIAEGDMLDGQPLSPLGNKFVFDHEGDPTSIESSPDQVGLVDLATGMFSTIDLLARPFKIYWSPDEKQFVYIARLENYLVQLVSYDVETNTNTILQEFLMENSGAYTRFNLIGFSPDGQQIAFIAKLNGQYDLYTLDTQALTLNQLTNTLEVELLASWSPIKNQLILGSTDVEDPRVFATWPYYSQRIELIGSDGLRTELFEDSNGITTVSWSPDGQRVVYPRNHTLCIMQVDTQVENCLQSEVLTKRSPAWREPAAWSANSQWLALRVLPLVGELCFQLYVIEVATTAIVGHHSSCRDSPVFWSRGTP
jgi:Tol biopolymer transport system component